MEQNELKELLDGLYRRYNTPDFIEPDPISIPHSFSKKEDIEISGFFASTIAWGNRKAIVKSANRMMDYMGREPYRFVTEASNKEIESLGTFVHRTFSGEDFRAFVLMMRAVCAKYGSLGNFFEQSYSQTGDIRRVLSNFRTEFLCAEHNPHADKHISSIDKGAACKRLCMYLRWMVRHDDGGVDFGLWRRIPASALYLPLDVHSGNISRQLGLLSRKQSDWKAVEEVTSALRIFDPSDPAKYDFALFGVGINQAL
ncbi:MAG: TIGR02757 family protein [Paludibacteraceae bacterium]|nr:TIGR02757 family protein [Paludibacteraceae bacterium]